MPNNEPTLYKRKDSHWWWMSWCTDNGKILRSCKKLGLDVDSYTKKQALEKVKAHFGVAPGMTTEGESIEWLIASMPDRLEKEGVRSGTIEQYMLALNNLRDMLGENQVLNTITKVPHVDQYKRYLFSLGLSPATINIRLRSLRSIFSRLYDGGIIQQNPFRKFKPVRVPREDKISLTDDELNRLFTVMEKARNQETVRFFRILLYTGRRVSEILQLHRDDVDLENNRFRPMNIKHRDRTKNWKTLHPKAAEEMRYFIEKYPRDLPFKICNRHTISQTFRRWRDKAELPKNIHLHHLRHTFSTHMLQSGADPYAVKRYLDHSTLAVTERYFESEQIDEFPGPLKP